MVQRLVVAVVVLLAAVPFLLAQDKNGTVTGTVLEADRPQPGLEVTLTDKDGKVAGKSKTSEKGTFEFKEVPAGSYLVSSAKPVTGRKGSVKAEVVAGKTVDVKISLLQ